MSALCKDCAFYGVRENCRRPIQPDLVRGGFYLTDYYADWERSSNRTILGRLKCGPRGRFFTPKEDKS